MAERVAADPDNRELLWEWVWACEALGDNAMTADAYTRAAVRLESHGSPIKATMFLEDALALDPLRADTRSLLVEFALIYSSREEAAEHYRQNLAAAGRTSPPWVERELSFAVIFLQSGRVDEGLQELAMAELLLRPRHPEMAEEVLAMMFLEDTDVMAAAAEKFMKRLTMPN